MPIVTSDLKIKLSIKTGTAGNQSAQADCNQSLGKYISQTEWLGGVLHDLFDVVTGSENAAGTVDYRCVFLHNNHASLTLENAVMWISAETAGGASYAIAVDSVAASLIGASSSQALFVANENTAPAAIVFSSPTSKGTGLALGDIAAGYCKAVWFRRTPANTGAVDNDSATISIEGDTAA